jgi:hypothetical protein
MFKGAWADTVVYALLAHEWHARQHPTSGAAAST